MSDYCNRSLAQGPAALASTQLTGRSGTFTHHLRAGFTLVEVLTVIGIIGLLTAILLPAVQASRDAAQKAGCANNLRQIGIGLTNFEAARGHFPPGQTWVPDLPSQQFSFAWSAHLLSFVEAQSIYDQLDFTVPFIEPQNVQAASQIVPIYLCPSTGLREPHRNGEDRLSLGGGLGDGLACIDYLGISGPTGTLQNLASGTAYGPQRGVLIGVKGLPAAQVKKFGKGIRTSQITDGLSNTAVVTECSGRGLDSDGDLHGTWVSGKNIGHIGKGVNSSRPPKAWTKERIFSQHRGGAFILFCDARVEFYSNDTASPVLSAICSRDGGEPAR